MFGRVSVLDLVEEERKAVLKEQDDEKVFKEKHNTG